MKSKHPPNRSIRVDFNPKTSVNLMADVCVQATEAMIKQILGVKKTIKKGQKGQKQ